jgi:hypothetical protein
MPGTSYRFGWYLAVLQLFFTLCWTVYVVYLPKFASAAGSALLYLAAARVKGWMVR